MRGPLIERMLQLVERGERVGDAPKEVAERAPELIRDARSGVIEIGGWDAPVEA